MYSIRRGWERKAYEGVATFPPFSELPDGIYTLQPGSLRPFKIQRRAGDLAQLAECLPNMPKARGPQEHINQA